MSVKLDNLQTDGIRTTGSVGGVSDQTLAALEGRLTHQLSEMQAAMVKSAQSGGSGPVTASEQMQPIYDLKAKMQELQTQLQSLYRAVQVRREKERDTQRERETHTHTHTKRERDRERVTKKERERHGE